MVENFIIIYGKSRACESRPIKSGMFLVIHFPIPIMVASKIISLCRNFLWRSKKPLLAWNQIYLPKYEGELGFRNLKVGTFGNIRWKKDDSPLLKKVLQIRDNIIWLKCAMQAGVNRFHGWTEHADSTLWLFMNFSSRKVLRHLGHL